MSVLSSRHELDCREVARNDQNAAQYLSVHLNPLSYGASVGVQVDTFLQSQLRLDAVTRIQAILTPVDAVFCGF